MKFLFIVNPNSGPAGNESAVDSIKDHVLQNKIDAQLLFTSGNKDDDTIKKELDTFKPDRVIACGGDGTIQLVARALMNRHIPLAIVPLGSANGLATALDIPKQPNEALELALSSSRTLPVDFLKFNNQWICVHLSDIGPNALLIRNRDLAGDKGMLGYAKHLLSALHESNLMRYSIETDEGSYVKEGYMLAIANAHKYGTGVHISDGSVSDGKFEISNIQQINAEAAIKAGLTALNIFIDKNMFSDVISCKKAVISVDRKAPFQIDGEYMGEVDRLEVKIIESPIHIVVRA